MARTQPLNLFGDSWLIYTDWRSHISYITVDSLQPGCTGCIKRARSTLKRGEISFTKFLRNLFNEPKTTTSSTRQDLSEVAYKIIKIQHLELGTYIYIKLLTRENDWKWFSF